jgi:serine/threonine protein kinase/ABC-type branched-subunit amino acid transport system substrate-binding protein
MNVTSGLKHCPACGNEYHDEDTCPHDGATLIRGPVADPLLGQILKGSYKVLSRIGEGGMGVVYQATQLSLGRPVAVKAVFATPLHAPEVVQRFFREAKLLSQINHPNVVNLIDFGNTDSGVVYMVMEHLAGRTLDKAVPKGEGFAVSVVLDLMEQVGAGVAEAHRLGVVHRDLKPSNIFLADAPVGGVVVKILDFGIAKAVGDGRPGLTQSGAMIGSSGYMPPEQITGSSEVDARSDVYALGGILYYMLAGKPAYDGKSTRSVVTKQMAGGPEPVHFERLGKPEAWRIFPVILKAMAADPAQRYQSVAEFTADLRAACGAPEPLTGTRLRQGILLSDAGAAAHSTIVPSQGGTKERSSANHPATHHPATQHPADPVADPRTRKVLLVGGGVGLLLLAYIAGMLVLQMARKDNNAPAAPAAPAKAGAPAAAAPRATTTDRGVTDDDITLGMSAAFSGPARELGRGMKLGLETRFRFLNEQGGVAGRKVNLVALDDGYEPGRALQNMRELYDQHKAFAVVGNVGTPTAAVTIPYAIENKMIFFGAFTGSKLLRKDPPDRFVFNYRASYGEETAAVVKYLIEIRKVKPEQIAVFAQNDSYGDAGFEGVAKTLRHYGRDKEQILRVGYERNTADVAAAVAEILKHRDAVKAVVMVPTYRPGARFIQQLKDAKLDAVFANVSFVGSDALAEELKQLGSSYADGVIVTQVVPHFESRSSLVLKYRELLKKYFPAEQPGFVSLEGYIAACVFEEALKKAGTELTTDTLIDALESTRGLDLGIGAPINFGPSEHQGSHKVWGTVLDKSFRYQLLDLD